MTVAKEIVRIAQLAVTSFGKVRHSEKFCWSILS